MEGKRRDTGIPEFESLEEEREYWETRGPLAEEHKGRINKPKPAQRRSSFLAVRLTGEELTHLRDMAAKQGLGTSTFARLILTSVIKRRENMPEHLTLDYLNDVLEKNLPQSIKDQAESLMRATSLGSADNPSFLLLDKSQMNELGELGLQAIYTLLGLYDVQIITKEHTKYKELQNLVQSST